MTSSQSSSENSGTAAEDTGVVDQDVKTPGLRDALLRSTAACRVSVSVRSQLMGWERRPGEAIWVVVCSRGAGSKGGYLGAGFGEAQGPSESPGRAGYRGDAALQAEVLENAH